MSLAAAAGSRVLLVCATRGEEGEPVEGVLAKDEELGDRRMAELALSARILGAEEPHWLGYEDSGMMGEPANDNPGCFWQADVEEAAKRLAIILTEVDASVLTIYDSHGTYGHPDHIQVHLVGLRAAKIAGIENVFEATGNRTRFLESMASPDPAMVELMKDGPDAADMETFGTARDDLSYEIDVSAVIDTKRKAMMAHASQIGPDSFFLAMPPEAFVEAFGIESFNIPGRTNTGGPEMVNLLPGL